MASTPSSWARSATSQATARALSPSRATNSAAPGASAPRRLVSRRSRTPCSLTRWRATSAPRAPVPPVTRTVPSPKDTGVAGSSEAGQARASRRPSRSAIWGSSVAMDGLRRNRVGVGVDQHEAARVLGLGAADQAGHGRGDEVRALAATVGRARPGARPPPRARRARPAGCQHPLDLGVRVRRVVLAQQRDHDQVRDAVGDDRAESPPASPRPRSARLGRGSMGVHAIVCGRAAPSPASGSRRSGASAASRRSAPARRSRRSR